MVSRLQRGFTLLELSVALVVIGLLIAAVFTGGELIKGAEVKSIIAEVNEYKASMGQFELLYDGLPGDVADATDYWSGSANGDGDGLIDAETSDEPFRAIEQLALAELIDGTYTGTWSGGFVLADAGVSGNTPKSASGRPQSAIYVKCCSITDYARTLSFNNHVVVFSIYNADNDFREGILSPIEARSVDKKIDDGVPDTGLVGASGSYTGASYAATGCYSGVGESSTYDSAVSANKDEANCQMQFAYDWD